MDTIIERNSDASAMMLVLVLVIVAAIAGFVLYMLQVYPFSDSRTGDTINIQLDGEAKKAVLPRSDAN